MISGTQIMIHGVINMIPHKRNIQNDYHYTAFLTCHPERLPLRCAFLHCIRFDYRNPGAN